MLRQLLSQYEFSTCKPQIELLSPEELLLTWKKLAILGLVGADFDFWNNFSIELEICSVCDILLQERRIRI